MRKLLLLVVLAAACKGAVETPTGPPRPAATPTPAPRILLRDGASGQTVGDLPPQASGSTIEANVPGYLPRRAIFRGEDEYLWPQAEDYTTGLVYRSAGDGELYAMGRWTSRTVTVGAPDDPRTLAAVRPAVEEAASASGLTLSLVPGQGDITIQVDASEFENDRTIAFAEYLAWSGLELRRARIVFRDNNDLVGSRKAHCGNTLLHELGHALGFYGHSIVGGEIMNAECSRRTADSFGANERLALRMMYQHRRPANIAPDSEWDARARAAVRRPPPRVE